MRDTLHRQRNAAPAAPGLRVVLALSIGLAVFLPGIAAGQPEKARTLVQQADTLLRKGQAKEALAQHEQALKVEREYIPALIGRAWILATDEQLRKPDEAVRDAERGLYLILRMFNDRRRWKSPSAAVDPVATKVNLIRAADTLAAAYAAQGRFKAAAPQGLADKTIGTDTPPGVTARAAATELGDSVGLTAQGLGGWALDAAQQEARTNPSPTTRRLLQDILAHVKAYRAERAITERGPR